MADTVLDELVIRLGLDTSALQGGARTALNTLDTLEARSRSVSAHMAASLSQTQREVLGLMGVITGGRGLSAVLGLPAVLSSSSAGRRAGRGAADRGRVSQPSLAAFYRATPPGAESGVWSAGLPRTQAFMPRTQVSAPQAERERPRTAAVHTAAERPVRVFAPAGRSEAARVRGPDVAQPSLVQNITHNVRTGQQHVLMVRQLPLPRPVSLPVQSAPARAERSAPVVHETEGNHTLTVLSGGAVHPEYAGRAEQRGRPVSMMTEGPALSSPYGRSAPLMQAATVPPAALATPAVTRNTTHIGPVTISAPSGNADEIAQALQRLGEGSSQTLAGLSTLGSV